MIRISDNKLIIEFSSVNTSPLVKLQSLQTGLIDVLGIIAVAEEAPPMMLQNSLQQIHSLLQEMQFGEFQSGAIDSCLKTNKDLIKSFN